MALLGRVQVKGAFRMTYEEFLKHAEECERLAGTATVPSNRHALLSAAEMWRKLAADTKPRDGADQVPF